MAESNAETATIYRMVMPKHLCPFGLKSVDLLNRKGYKIDDHWLTSQSEHETFKADHEVETTPQTFIGGKRIGGWDDLRRFFGMRVADPDAVTYRPVIVVFAVAALMSLAATWATSGTLLNIRSGEWFIAFSMCILALLKLQDIESFSIMFLGYDLLARKYVPYSYVHPYAELLAGVLMAAGALIWISAPVALFIGGVGAVSVFKAVFIDQREVKCACVGGNTKAPLGFVSLTENLMMIAMAIWMVVRYA